jgi:hypothetical protein
MQAPCPGLVLMATMIMTNLVQTMANFRRSAATNDEADKMPRPLAHAQINRE